MNPMDRRVAAHEHMEATIRSLCPGQCAFMTDTMGVMISLPRIEVPLHLIYGDPLWSVIVNSTDGSVFGCEFTRRLSSVLVEDVTTERALRMALQFIQGEPMR